MTADISDFYLGTVFPTPEYMWINKSQIPISTQIKYSNQIVWKDDKALVRIDKGIYGFPYAGRIAQAKLTALLSRRGYTEAPNTPFLFRHATRPIMFSLVVYDFGIKYKGKEHADHLLSVISWSGERYLGMSIVSLSLVTLKSHSNAFKSLLIRDPLTLLAHLLPLHMANRFSILRSIAAKFYLNLALNLPRK